MENTCTPNIKSSYTYEDLLASGRGELFGKEGPQLPAPTMLMMDRIVKMTEDGGAFGKGYIEAWLLRFRCDVAISGFLPWLGWR